MAVTVGVASMVPAGEGQLQSAKLESHAIALLQRACQNCHSNQPEWPAYSRIAPVSWMIRKDFSEGRKFLNFSQWPDYRPYGQSQLFALAAELKALRTESQQVLQRTK